MEIEPMVIHFNPEVGMAIARGFKCFPDLGDEKKIFHSQVIDIGEEGKKEYSQYEKALVNNDLTTKKDIEKRIPQIKFYHSLRKDKHLQWDSVKKYAIDTKNINIAILHHSNALIEEFFREKLNDKQIPTIIVSGGGAFDKTSYTHKDDPYVCCCDIGDISDDGNASDFHLKEFLEDWHLNKQRNMDQFGVLWNFHKLVGKDFIYLPVILMLCQCYLTVYAESGECEKDDTVGKALDRMGWERLKKVLPGSGTSLQIGKHFRQNRKVGDAAWFRNFFKKDDVNRGTLTQGIKSEWGSHQEETLAAIIKLIDAVYDGDGSNYTPPTVAGAYLAAVEKIGG